MSRLAVGKEDHPEAAQKHFDDLQALVGAKRHDGAAYHAGYVVECALKAVLLHDRSYVPADGTTDTTALAKWRKQLSRKPYGHDLQRLLAEVVGPEGARYLPQMPAGSVVVNGWTETMRYWAPGAVNEADANTFQAEAGVAIATVLRMKQDGVL